MPASAGGCGARSAPSSHTSGRSSASSSSPRPGTTTGASWRWWPTCGVAPSRREPADRGERDLEPGRPVAGLVDRLVDGLVELEGLQQQGLVAGVLTGRGGVAVAEGVAVAG